MYYTLSKSSVVGTQSITEPSNSAKHTQEHSLGEFLDAYSIADYKIGSACMV